jgi:TonB family protein
MTPQVEWRSDMKLNFLCLAAILAASATPTLALDASAYAHWEHRLRERVNALHFYPQGAEKGARGDVLVRFRIGGDGKPADITIVRSSGQAIFDTAAVRLVSGLGRLGPVPADRGVDRVTLKLSYGEGSSLAEDKRLAKGDAEERASNERRNRLIVAQPAKLADRR